METNRHPEGPTGRRCSLCRLTATLHRWRGLYGHHRMALVISFALSLTVIPVMWVIAGQAPQLLWYSYLIAYLLEALFICVLRILIYPFSHAIIQKLFVPLQPL